MHKGMDEFEYRSDPITDYKLSALEHLFQVQSYLPLSIVNKGVSKHYAGSMVSDPCLLGYLFPSLYQSYGA